jgi:hypothetical protein
MAMGFWADVRVGRGAVTLRFQEVSPVGGNPVYSTTLHFANRAWAKPIRSQVAMQGKIPAVQPPYGRFTTRERAKLRAAPAIDDTSEVPDGFDHTATMGGNVLAVYGAGARGLLLAREGAFRYVAFDAPIRPLETSPMDDGTNIDPSQYHARCGWISEGELVE